MKTSAPVHVDRLAQALKAQGIELKRSRVIELAAAAFGYHNSNEFQAAARTGDLTPPDADAVGSVTLPDGSRLAVLLDGRKLPYALAESQIGQDRNTTIGISPYGGLVTLPADGVDLKDLQLSAVPASAAHGPVYLAIVEYDVDRIVGAGRIKVVAGTSPEARETALADFCRSRWEMAHTREGMIEGHLPLETDGLAEKDVIETYFAATTDVLLNRETVTVGATAPSATMPPVAAGHVAIDLDTLSALVEAADAHADTLGDDLQDDMRSSDDLESIQENLEGVNAAVTHARSLYGTTRVSTTDDIPTTGYDAARFVLVDRDALAIVVGGAESHVEDAETGVEDGVYEASENEWTGKMREAIAAVQSAEPVSVADARVETPGIVHVAIMRTQHGDDVRFSQDPVALDRMIADHCRSNWGSLTSTAGGDLDPALLPDTQVIQMFYSAHAADDEPGYSLDRREQETDPKTAAQLAQYEVTWSRAVFDVSLDPETVAASLDAAVDADIWDTDAASRRDAEAVTEIANAKMAMREAAALLRSRTQQDARPGQAPASSELDPRQPAWLTDVEGDIMYGATREQLEALELDYTRGNSKEDWLPLTEDEMSYLQPGASIASNPWEGRVLTIPEDDGIEVRLGQSCIWRNEKWQVPSVEMSFGEGERDQAYAAITKYADQLRPLVERLGGKVDMLPDATDYAHGIDVFLPMSLALEFEGSEDWGKALKWLLCPADRRSELVTVTARFETPQSGGPTEPKWDATFDVLREGRGRMLGYVRGDRDDELTMRLAQSPLAHKDAWSLWNEDWDLELDMDALQRLYSIR